MTNHSSYLSKSLHRHPISYRIKPPFTNLQCSALSALATPNCRNNLFQTCTVLLRFYPTKPPDMGCSHHAFIPPPWLCIQLGIVILPFSTWQPQLHLQDLVTWNFSRMLLLTFFICHFIHSLCPAVLSIICLFFCVFHSL